MLKSISLTRTNVHVGCLSSESFAQIQPYSGPSYITITQILIKYPDFRLEEYFEYEFNLDK